MSTCPRCGWYKFYWLLNGDKKCAACGHEINVNLKG